MKKQAKRAKLNRISLRMPHEIIPKLRKIARLSGCSVSQVIAVAVATELVGEGHQ